MDRGLYIAASGMIAEQVHQDQIAADLANANTPGYKADRSAERSFGELLLENTSSGAVVGPLGLGTQVDKVVTSLAQAPLRQTDEPLDVALEGSGFLEVRTPNGVRYTRDGQLVVDAQGRLTTVGDQFPLLDAQGRDITVGSGKSITIAADGTVTAGGTTVGRIGVVDLTNAKKFGDNLFTGTAGPRPTQTNIRQGYLESSGVDPARSMIDMIVSLRAYEAGQRVIQAIDETLQRGIQSGGPGGG